MLLSVVRSRSGDVLVPRLWSEAGANPRPGIACPLCRRSSFALVTHGVELDLCRACQSLWFDADKLHHFPIRGAPTRQQIVVDTTKHQPPNRRTDPTTEDEGSVVGEVVDAVFDILTNWD
jgi:Zn-finger nucleic acid-binding protein